MRSRSSLVALSEHNSGDAAVCSSPGSSAAWKLQWGTGPATHFSNKLALNTDCMGHLYFDCSHS